ncbi:response regulator [Marinimicrococcus flavescens]|uniref:Response regulator n=1 Tax=Marinimicrococcus flavescens TaxID=3031815 RepID=A0AAP3XRC9_9PROT|nr:response regulator [Marinimicrococcus flavescens]
MSTVSPAAGPAVLVVEDEALVLMLIEETLTDHGFCPVGPASRLAEALELAATRRLDAAVLDINLNGEEVFPVVELLAARGVPFLFLTGYGRKGLRGRWSNAPVMQKPFAPDELVRRLGQLIVPSP